MRGRLELRDVAAPSRERGIRAHLVLGHHCEQVPLPAQPPVQHHAFGLLLLAAGGRAADGERRQLRLCVYVCVVGGERREKWGGS